MDLAYTLRMMATLSLLCGILYLVLKWAERLKLKKFSGEMRVLDRLPVGPNQTLMIVKVRTQDYLMAVGRDVTVLKELNETVLD